MLCAPVFLGAVAAKRKSAAEGSRVREPEPGRVLRGLIYVLRARLCPLSRKTI